VHITECIFKLLVSLHNHLPLHRKCNLIFWGLSWGISGLAQDNGCWRHPWLIFKTSLALRTTVVRDPCFVTLAVPNRFRYLVWGQELSYLSLHTHHRLSTKEGIFSLSYYHVVKTGGLPVKCHILWLFMAWVFTYQSFYFYIADFSWNYNPKWILPQRCLNFSTCYESVTSTVKPVMSFIYLCGNGMQSLYTVLFPNLPSVTVYDLKWM